MEDLSRVDRGNADDSYGSKSILCTFFKRNHWDVLVKLCFAKFSFTIKDILRLRNGGQHALVFINSYIDRNRIDLLHP